MMRGDSVEQTLLSNAAALVGDRGIDSDADLGPVFDSPPPEADPEVIKRLRQMYEAGGWVLVESAIADLPADLRWLFESEAVTLEQLAAIHRALGVTALADLSAAVTENALARVEGIGPEGEARIASALPSLRRSIPRIPLGRAAAIAEPILNELRAVPGVGWAHPVGSLRRGQDMVGDVEIVASSADPAAAIARVLPFADGPRLLHRSERRVYILADRVQVGVRLAEPANAGAMLLHLTGSTAHFSLLQTTAPTAGWRLSQDGLHDASGCLRAAASEEEIYAALGLPWIPPEIRDGTEEVDAAKRNALPALVSRSDMCGDLHMHTTWSDGRDSVDAMVQACAALGYDYIAITDHSPHSAASRNLSIDAVKRQAEEIGEAQTRYPRITILHGCEVDILTDGRLDFPDRVLERFDIVLASLHDHAGHSAGQLLQRYVTAMRHPLVTIITHPTNRQLPNKPGYDLDYDRLFAAAVETKTALEIDGAPSHLDLDGALARRAISAGATMSIDSDCHRAELLERQMQLGIVTARRGWVEPRHVLNARPLQEVRAVIAEKRAGR